MKNISLIIILQLFAQFTFAQYQIGLVPRVSPDKAVYQKVGLTEIDIKYGSPAVKEREIWGGLVPYDKVWRAGANYATTIEFKSAVNINNQSLAVGKYTFFVIPRKDKKWTAIFNSVEKQWGAFKYDAEKDALRVDIIPESTANFTENLTYAFKQQGYEYGSIVLAWEHMEIEIPFATNYLDEFSKGVETRAREQPDYLKWIVYLQGAEHLEQINSKPELANEWLAQAEKFMNSTTEWNDQFYPRDYVKGHLYWTKAKCLAGANQFSEAVKYVEQLKNLENKSFYEKENEEEAIDELLEAWKSK